MVKCSFLFTESVLRVRNQGQQKFSDANFSFVGKTQEFNEHSKLLSQNAFSSLQTQYHPPLFKDDNCLSFQGKISIDHVLIFRGLQTLGCTELLKIMDSFPRYSQTSMFYSPKHPNYCDVVRVYYIFLCQLIFKIILTYSENHTK